MKKTPSTKSSLLRHEISDVVGGLKTAADLLKGSLAGNGAVEKLINLGSKKLSGLLDYLDADGDPVHLVGSYVLEKFELRNGKADFSPWGTNVHGLLIYTADGTMSVSINRDCSDPFDNREFPDTSILFYSGTYEILPEGQVIHQVTQATDKTRIGKKELRLIRRDGSRLTHTAEGKFGEARLTWRKL